MTLAAQLLPLLEKMTGSTVLTVGDVMLDRFIYGQVDRISPEAPVPVLSVKRKSLSPGGVGNVAANLSGLGCTVRLVSVTGDDAPARALSDALEAGGIHATLISDASRPTIQKDRFIATGQQMLRVDEESTAPLSTRLEDELIAASVKAAKGCDVIIVSDYGKGVVGNRLIRALIDTGIPVFIDPKGFDYAKYKGAALITPNRKELADATRSAASSDSDVVEACEKLMKECGIKAVLATRSADGMTLVGHGEPTHLRTQAREIYDVSGAGDTVIATVAAAVASGADMVSAAALANIAAGIVVEKVGTAAIRSDDIVRFLNDNTHHVDLLSGTPHGRTIAPVLSWIQAQEQVERWRARGQKIGFTNGCFDLIHQGHVTMLDRCRAACDRLVLGLNCDASVSRLKGPTRPVNGEQARARVIAALGSIDAVVLFGADLEEGDTPLNLIKHLRPDMIFKGADYTAATVVGADFVESYGGKVVLIPLEEGFSTTNTIKKLGAA